MGEINGGSQSGNGINQGRRNGTEPLGIWTEQLGDKEKLMGEGLSYWDKLQEKKRGTEECAVG